MRGNRVWMLLLLGVWVGLAPTLAPGVTPALADETQVTRPLENTDAFDRAFAESFYHFDACGDGLAGRNYRRALTERFAQCPFSPAAGTRFRQISAAQSRKSRDMIARLIEDNGGMPVRLEGMTRTCREQIDSPEYQAVRHALDDYGSGKASVETVIASSCDAKEIVP